MEFLDRRLPNTSFVYVAPGDAVGYEMMKELTRGKDGITRDAVHSLIRSLKIPEAEKKRLLALTPLTYLGKAAELAKHI